MHPRRHVSPATPRTFRASLLLTVIVLGATACDSPPPAVADAAVDAAVPDVGSVDAGPADVPPVDVAPADVGAACADFSGGYALEGECAEGIRFGSVACVAQTGCEARVSLLGQTVTGTVDGDNLTFQSTISGERLNCTATVSGRVMALSCTTETGTTCAVRGTHDARSANRYCCDVAAQDCGAGQRCALFAIDETNAFLVAACLPAGTLAPGEGCMSAGPRVGEADGCAPGSQCVPTGAADARVCRRLCREDANCGAGQFCYRTAAEPNTGMCLSTCALGGSKCAAGTSCRGTSSVDVGDEPSRVHATCEPDGPTAEGGFCERCQAGLMCIQLVGRRLECRPTCDATHRCATGQMCVALSGVNPTRVGACFPSS